MDAVYRIRPSDAELIRLAGLYTSLEIQAMYGVGRTSVQKWMKDLGIQCVRLCNGCGRRRTSEFYRSNNSRVCIDCKQDRPADRILPDEYADCLIGRNIGSGGRLSYWVQGGQDYLENCEG